MTYDLTEKTTKQATAFVMDGLLEEAIKLSVDNFVNHEADFQQFENKSLLDKLTPHERHRIDHCYFRKVREHNVPKLT